MKKYRCISITRTHTETELVFELSGIKDGLSFKIFIKNTYLSVLHTHKVLNALVEYIDNEPPPR